MRCCLSMLNHIIMCLTVICCVCLLYSSAAQCTPIRWIWIPGQLHHDCCCKCLLHGACTPICLVRAGNIKVATSTLFSQSLEVANATWKTAKNAFKGCTKYRLNFTNSTLLRLGALWVIKGRLVAFDVAASKTRNQVCNHSLSVAACKAAFVH